MDTRDTRDTTSDRLRIALIVGSVRSGRLADCLVTWLRARLDRVDWLTLDVVDLADVELPPQDMAPGATTAISERLRAAEGFLVLTPEYNHSFPGSLKNAIDWHVDEWARKPVGFVAYGAGSGGIRAVEQLRQVFAELRATTVRNAVHLPQPWDRLDDRGDFDADGPTDAALGATLEDLRWWAEALRTARTRELVAP